MSALAYAAKQAVSLVGKQLAKRDTESKKKPIGIVVGILFFILIVIPAGVVSLPGLVMQGIVSSISDVFCSDAEEFQKTELYQGIKGCYIKYITQLKADIEEEIKSKQEEYPDATIKKSVDTPSICLIYAYITTKYQEDMKNYQYNEQEILDFLNQIVTIQSKIDTQTDPTTQKETKIITVGTVVLDSSKIGEVFFTGSNQSFYSTSVKSFQRLFEDIEDEELDSAYESDTQINVDQVVYENGMEIPHYLQYDTRWGNYTYGRSTIHNAGCGPTSMAMVDSYMTGKTTLPTDTTDWSNKNQGYILSGNNTLTSWGFFKRYANSKGYNCTQYSVTGSMNEIVVQALQNGKPIITSMRAGTFTKGGHFIVLRGVTKSGKILVNDPNDNKSNKNFYQREFDFNIIKEETKQYWIFSK